MVRIVGLHGEVLGYMMGSVELHGGECWVTWWRGLDYIVKCWLTW